VRGLDGQVSGSLAANPGRGELNASEFSITAKGSYEKDAFTLVIAAPQLAVTTGKAAGKAVTADLKMKGPSRNVDAKLRLEGLEGTAEALSIASLGLDLDAAIAPNVVKGKISTPVKGNLKQRSVELPKIVADLTITSPQIPQKTVTLPIRASVRANYEKQSGAVELNTTFDESTIQAKFGATKLDPLVATFDLKIDRLNLDRYLPPEKKDSNPNERLDLSALKGRTATGKAEIGAITARRVKLSNVKADIKLAGGKLEVSPHSANLYGGTLAGNLGADANGNRITMKETIQGVQVGPLLRDAVEQDRLEGRGNVSFDVAMAGPSIASLKKSMGGSARVEVRDGAVKGINLGEAIGDVRSVIGKGPKDERSVEAYRLLRDHRQFCDQERRRAQPGPAGQGTALSPHRRGRHRRRQLDPQLRRQGVARRDFEGAGRARAAEPQRRDDSGQGHRRAGKTRHHGRLRRADCQVRPRARQGDRIRSAAPQEARSVAPPVARPAESRTS
jgi:AsmA protein